MTVWFHSLCGSEIDPNPDGDEPWCDRCRDYVEANSITKIQNKEAI